MLHFLRRALLIPPLEMDSVLYSVRCYLRAFVSFLVSVVAMQTKDETDADSGSAVSTGDAISTCTQERGFSAAAFLGHGAGAIGRTAAEK